MPGGMPRYCQSHDSPPFDHFMLLWSLFVAVDLCTLSCLQVLLLSQKTIVVATRVMEVVRVGTVGTLSCTFFLIDAIVVVT